MAVLERKVKVQRNKEVPLVNVQWEYRRGSKWTWELAAEMREHYPVVHHNIHRGQSLLQVGENCNIPTLRYEIYGLKDKFSFGTRRVDGLRLDVLEALNSTS